MGDFSVNCALSNHAVYNARVVGLVVKKNPSHNGDMPLYPDDMWMMDSFAFRGKVNTYGDLIIDKDSVAHRLFKKLTTGYIFPEGTLQVYKNLSWMYILEDVYDFVMGEESDYIQEQLVLETSKTPLHIDLNRYGTLTKDEIQQALKTGREQTPLKFYANKGRDETVFSTALIRKAAKNKSDYALWLEEALKHMILHYTFTELRRYIFPTHNVGNNKENFSKLSKFDAFVAKRSKLLERQRRQHD